MRRLPLNTLQLHSWAVANAGEPAIPCYSCLQEHREYFSDTSLGVDYVAYCTICSKPRHHIVTYVYTIQLPKEYT